MDAITRREKLYAKVCWPEIDTQRTRFHRIEGSAPIYALPVFEPRPLVYHGDNVPVASRIEYNTERIMIDKWVYHGKRRHVVARWGYSRRLDVVVIRELRTAHNWAIDCDVCE